MMENMDVFIEFDEILDHIRSTRSKTKKDPRPLREGFRLMKSDHITKYGIVEERNGTYILIGYCLTSSLKTKAPHKIIIKHPRVNDVSFEASCSCEANSNRCKHIIGLLLKLENMPVSEIARVNKTEVEQTWGKVSKQCIEKYNACRIENFCHVQAEKEPYEGHKLPSALTPELKKIIFNDILRAFPDSAASSFLQKAQRDDDTNDSEIHIHPSKDFLLSIITSVSESFPNLDNCYMDLNACSQDIINFYHNRIVVTAEEAVQISELTISQKNSSMWFLHRKLRITSSIAYSVFTASANKKNPPNWSQKIRKIIFSTFHGNKATQHGQKYENAAIQQYSNLIGKRIEKTGLVINCNLPWFAFSPDGILLDDEGLILREVKCPFKNACDSAVEMMKTFKHVKFDAQNTPFLTKKDPYYGQIQFALALSNIKRAKLLIYNVKENLNVVIDVPYDHVFGTSLLASLSKIYFQHWLPCVFEICK